MVASGGTGGEIEALHQKHLEPAHRAVARGTGSGRTGSYHYHVIVRCGLCMIHFMLPWFFIGPMGIGWRIISDKQNAGFVLLSFVFRNKSSKVLLKNKIICKKDVDFL